MSPACWRAGPRDRKLFLGYVAVNHFEKSVFRRDGRNEVAAATANHEFYLPNCRNQRNAMEVCASLASCPPWNVPIFIR